MTVYVDNARIPYGRMKMAHMTADTLDELHAMASKLGLRRWFQEPPKASRPHYDISQSKRAEAVSMGAVEGDITIISEKSNQLMIEWVENSDLPEPNKRFLIDRSRKMIDTARKVRDMRLLS